MKAGNMKRRSIAIATAVILAGSLMTSPTGAGPTTQDLADGPSVEIKIKGRKLVVPDLVLRDQDNRKVRFYSDLLKDKVFVLSFFYTSCTFVCTMQGKVFSELQALLGERLGKSVFLVSVTTDPERDNPQQLKAWATRYKLQPGWTLVTGDVAEMNELLRPFTGDKAGGGMHLPVVFIGNDRKGLWTSATGIFAAKELLDAVNHFSEVSAVSGPRS
jgi:protein SCO1